MDQNSRSEKTAQYEDGYRAIEEAIAGLTDEEMSASEGPGEWCPREVIHHLADSEMTSAIRLRRLIAEESPAIVGYDEAEFARSLYHDRPIEPSLAAFKAARETSAQILKLLTPEQWSRAGTHSDTGRFSVDDWLDVYSVHAHDHADQIRRAVATVRP